MENLPVIFRAERSGPFKGHITAVFPTLPGTRDPRTFQIYAHVGQHSSGAVGWYQATRAARPEEYADLLAELRGIYETHPPGDCAPVRLVVAHRMTRHHETARRAELES